MSKINFFKNALKLTTTENIILESASKFCKTELSKNILKDFKHGAPKDIYKKLGDMGLLGPTVKDYNCLGTSFKMYGLIGKEIEKIDSGYRSMYSVQSSLVMKPIEKYGG